MMKKIKKDKHTGTVSCGTNWLKKYLLKNEQGIALWK